MVLEIFGYFAPVLNAFYELLMYIASFFSLTMRGLTNMLDLGYLTFGFTNVFTGEYKSFFYRSSGSLADWFYTLVANIMEQIGTMAGVSVNAPLYVWLFVAVGSFWVIASVFIAVKNAIF